MQDLLVRVSKWSPHHLSAQSMSPMPQSTARRNPDQSGKQALSNELDAIARKLAGTLVQPYRTSTPPACQEQPVTTHRISWSCIYISTAPQYGLSSSRNGPGWRSQDYSAHKRPILTSSALLPDPLRQHATYRDLEVLAGGSYDPISSCSYSRGKFASQDTPQDKAKGVHH